MRSEVAKSLRYAAFERDKWACQYCGIRVDRPSASGISTRTTASADHIVPQSLGGETTLANFRTACFSCNATKRDNSTEWLRMFFALAKTKLANVITLDQYHQLKALGVRLEELPVQPFFFEGSDER